MEIIKVCKLSPGDIFTITGTDKYLKKQIKNFSNNNLLIRIIKKEYYKRPWYKFFIPKKLKSLTIMYLGENKND